MSRARSMTFGALGVLAACAAIRCDRPPPPRAATLTGPAPLVFYKTQRSDAWVEQTFHVETRYRRVLLVDGSAAPARVIHVGKLDLNARRPPPERLDLPVNEVFPTIQAAVDASRGGDLIAVAPGVYEGFWAGERPETGDDRYIHIRALGDPGQVIINSPCQRDKRWMVLFEATHHLILQGFNIQGAATPGDLKAKGPWAGIMLDGDFGRSGRLTHHIAIVDNFSHNHKNWGLHSTDTHSVLIQGNLFARSAAEHSAYVSDGSDDYVIRRNVFFGSYACGLQCNLDPEASLQEVKKHAAFRDYPAYEPTAAWAEGLLARATALFGEHGFPDGRGVNFIIEENVINDNGKRGGGALNLAGLQESLIQNNLLYGNFNHGIAQWDNANPFDAVAVKAQSPALLPRWGCHDNLIRNNTVLMANPHRGAVVAFHGSYNSRLYNNILLNDADASVAVDATSVRGLDAQHNVIGRVLYQSEPFEKTPGPLLSPASQALAAHPPEGSPSLTRQDLAPDFARYGEEPWVIIEGSWWRLNPDRPDFRPSAGAPRLAGQGDRAETPPLDLEGRARTSADIGALGPSAP